MALEHFHFRGAGARSCMLDGELSESSWINYKAVIYLSVDLKKLVCRMIPNKSRYVEISKPKYSVFSQGA